VGCREHVPVWHEATREWAKNGRLAVLGVAQEQHDDRCRLFAQWKGFDWPILHDPINLLEAPAVPIIVAIDEYGIVRSIRPRIETFAAEFVDKTFSDDAPAAEPRPAGRPDPAALWRKAEAAPSADAWRDAGDALALWGAEAGLDQAIDAYGRSVALDSNDRNALFRLGVVHRLRHESGRRRTGDFQAAVVAWCRARELDPNQYIWRRRIEQYGPRLTKPYAFYDWVVRARTEIGQRGETPVALNVEPYGSELAGPAGNVVPDAHAPVEPDPKGEIHRDAQRLVDAEIAVVPARIKPGQAARVHLTFRPSTAHKARWNNESSPLRVWVTGAPGWAIAPRLLEAAADAHPESDEVRRIEFEVKAPASAAGKAQLEAYALYNVCEQAGGRCVFVRQDMMIEVDVAK
jgi:hypothetical protein